MRNYARSESGVRGVGFHSYSTGRILRRGFRLKIEDRDRTLARAGPTAGRNSSQSLSAVNL